MTAGWLGFAADGSCGLSRSDDGRVATVCLELPGWAGLAARLPPPCRAKVGLGGVLTILALHFRRQRFGQLRQPQASTSEDPRFQEQKPKPAPLPHLDLLSAPDPCSKAAIRWVDRNLLQDYCSRLRDTARDMRGPNKHNSRVPILGHCRRLGLRGSQTAELAS
mgnify:CR=1 FL=1